MRSLEERVGLAPAPQVFGSLAAIVYFAGMELGVGKVHQCNDTSNAAGPPDKWIGHERTRTPTKSDVKEVQHMTACKVRSRTKLDYEESSLKAVERLWAAKADGTSED